MTRGKPSVGPIVEYIAREPGMADRLLAEHADDGNGHCRICTSGGQTGRHVWPCTLHSLAVQAGVLLGHRPP